MNAPLIPQANPGAAFRSRRDALLKAAADVLGRRLVHQRQTGPAV